MSEARTCMWDAESYMSGWGYIREAIRRGQYSLSGAAEGTSWEQYSSSSSLQILVSAVITQQQGTEKEKPDQWSPRQQSKRADHSD